MRKVTVAAIQMACQPSDEINIENAEFLVRQAYKLGAEIILIQELFERPYFCKVEKPDYYLWATDVDNNKAIVHFKKIAKELEIVIPISFYEKSNLALYNSVAMIDADGTVMGTYRKSHIPDGPGYEEKFYFNQGDTGFKVWNTKKAKIGVGICWDQWFPEAARCMALMGAELLMYPTAIGSEPECLDQDSKNHWQRCMQGHSAANIIPVIAANRIGTEREESITIEFYGSSFMTNSKGDIVREGSRDKEEILIYEYDLDQIRIDQMDWGVFRDRRPDLYGTIMTLDGKCE